MGNARWVYCVGGWVSGWVVAKWVWCPVSLWVRKANANNSLKSLQRIMTKATIRIQGMTKFIPTRKCMMRVRRTICLWAPKFIPIEEISVSKF
ncbi:hypothetical protein U1Q18_016584 [Sarracenia purpurea var. burkii]